MAIRQIFRRKGQEYVAVHVVRLDGATRLFPGDDVPPLREFHLRSLYRRGMIGVKGDQWSANQIARYEAKIAKEQTPLLDLVNSQPEVGDIKCIPIEDDEWQAADDSKSESLPDDSMPFQPD